MTNQVDYEYYQWLTSQIAVPKHNKNSYEDLFTRMYETEFVWFVPNDDNRMGDAEEIRREFLNGSVRVWRRPISVLEILIALSRRCAWNSLSDDGPEIWVW